jgi:ADP-ribosylglycohydrolase
MNENALNAIHGSLLGTAVGDSLGLPLENLSPERLRRLFPGPLRQRFGWGWGMVSDDTEHACLTALAYGDSQTSKRMFGYLLSWGLRQWFLGGPPGIGFATLRACLKLMIGFSWDTSGVWSAGNGPGMRAPILGVLTGDRPERLIRMVQASTIVTHTDPKAFSGSLILAFAAHWAMEHAGRDLAAPEFLARLRGIPEITPEAQTLAAQAWESAACGETVAEFARQIGSNKGISGYMYHTFPAVLQVWFRFPADFAGGLEEIIKAGGDADSTAAILGGIIGAAVGPAGIPESWKAIRDWPWNPSRIEALAGRLAGTSEGRWVPWVPWWTLPFQWVRNVGVVILILLHVVRRMLPPY